MKRNIKILIVSFLIFASCDDDFLALSPQSNPNTEDFYQTIEDFNAATIAIYASLQSGAQYGNNYFTLFEYRSDNLSPTSTSNPRILISEFDAGSANEIIDATWSSIYNTIFRCNVVLGRIDDVDFDEGLKSQYRGEAQFLRGLTYFNAIRIWGGVPIVLNELSPQESLGIGRSSIEQVYEIIEEDLSNAFLNLPVEYDDSAIGRATAGAAQALLAKVLVYQRKWNEANALLENIISSNRYQLQESIDSVFDVGNENNSEIIFAIKYSKNIVGEGQGFVFTGLEDGTTVVTEDLRSAYTEGDARLELLQLVPSGSDFVIAKYFDEFSSLNEVGNDIPVLRYAEVLLLNSEVLNEVGYQPDGEAFDLLNSVRERSGLPTLTSTDLPNQDSFRTLIYEERRRELALEADRWPDLVRSENAMSTLNGKTIDGFTYNIEPSDLLYPIPISEIQRINNEGLLFQNPGY